MSTPCALNYLQAYHQQIKYQRNYNHLNYLSVQGFKVSTLLSQLSCHTALNLFVYNV